MNILLVNEFYPDGAQPTIVGGVQARNYFVAKYLSEKHNVEVVSLNRGSIAATTLSMFPRLASMIRIILIKPKKRPDLIEASNVTTYFPAFLLAKRLGLPAVAWVPDVLGKYWTDYFPLPVAIAGRVMEVTGLKLPWNHWIAMSQVTQKKLIALGIPPERITVIYGGVEYGKLKALNVKKFLRPTVCTIARLLPYKRIADLIEAIAILKRKIPGIQCLIIGEGPEGKNLKSQITNRKLAKDVKLLGNLPYPDVTKTLHRSHLFCLPSLVEGFGIATVEALATGVPYVNARIPATEEITGNGKGGLLFLPQEIRDLAEKLNILFTNQTLYNQKKKEGQLLAKRFDWAIIARETEQVYTEAIRNFKS